MSEIQENLLKIEAYMKQNKTRKKIYLFLDFDGVINVFHQYDTYTEEEKIKLDNEKFEFADKRCIARLNKLCEDYPIHIIISSSWRFGRLRGCRKYLKEAGFLYPLKIKDTTQIKTFQDRQLDIEQYLLEHQDYKGFIILDDIEMKDLNKYLVHTDPFIGYSKERDNYARKIIESFNN